MAEVQRTRVRQREPDPGDLYAQHMAYFQELRDRALTGKIVVKASDRPFRQNRQGFMRHYLARETLKDTALHNWAVFIHDVHRHSGKHRHQGGLAIFVLEGEGYTVVNGERIDWEAGDLILLPIQPGGCEHQHFNRYADQPCKWMAFIHRPLHDEVGLFIEQREESPDYQG
jgi:hypothetical protein